MHTRERLYNNGKHNLQKYSKSVQDTSSLKCRLSSYNTVLVIKHYLYACACTQVSRSPKISLLDHHCYDVLYRTALVFQFAITAYLSGYSLVCQPVDYSTNPLALRVSQL